MLLTNQIYKTLVTTFIHPLESETHVNNILGNIYSGQEAGSDVTVNNSLEIGTKKNYHI